MLPRLFLFIFFILIIVFFFRSLQGKAAKKAEKKAEKKPEKTAEDMVRCAVCGVHQPVSESILSHGKYYCQAQHMQEDQ